VIHNISIQDRLRFTVFEHYLLVILGIEVSVEPRNPDSNNSNVASGINSNDFLKFIQQIFCTNMKEHFKCSQQRHS